MLTVFLGPLPGRSVVTLGVITAAAGATASVPAWFALTVALGGPALTVLGALFGHWLGRRATKEADDRAKREELMRTVRWAAEQVAGGNDVARSIAIKTVGAVEASGLLQDGDQAFIDAILQATVAEPVAAYDRAQDAPGSVG
jgi:hypothetical protein